MTNEHSPAERWKVHTKVLSPKLLLKNTDVSEGGVVALYATKRWNDYEDIKALDLNEFVQSSPRLVSESATGIGYSKVK